MKKIPTLFERRFENNKVVGITDKVTPGFEWVLQGEGDATIKHDGSCCAIINDEFYKRYDAKKGKPIPEGAIKCQDEPDPITGHMPCWVKCDRNNPADKWFWKALEWTARSHFSEYVDIPDGTYEAVGEHFNGNPYYLDFDMLMPHGKDIREVERSFEGIKKWLEEHGEEGLVFWKDGKPQCKIKRSDFGFEWPIKEDEV